MPLSLFDVHEAVLWIVSLTCARPCGRVRRGCPLLEARTAASTFNHQLDALCRCRPFYLLLLNQLTNLFREIGPLQGFVFQKADSNLRLLEPVLRAVAEKQEHLAGREDNGSRKRARKQIAGLDGRCPQEVGERTA